MTTEFKAEDIHYKYFTLIALPNEINLANLCIISKFSANCLSLLRKLAAKSEFFFLFHVILVSTQD